MEHDLIQVKCISAVGPYSPLSTEINNWIIENHNKYKVLDIKFVSLRTAYVMYVDYTGNHLPGYGVEKE